MALAPVEERPIRKGGQWRTVKRTIFPGYVFYEADLTAAAYHQIKRLPNIINLLGTPLTEREVEWIESLDFDGAPLRATKATVGADGTIKVLDGILARLPNRIISYSKRQRRAVVELTICGEPHRITLGLEIT